MLNCLCESLKIFKILCESWRFLESLKSLRSHFFPTFFRTKINFHVFSPMLVISQRIKPFSRCVFKRFFKDLQDWQRFLKIFEIFKIFRDSQKQFTMENQHSDEKGQLTIRWFEWSAAREQRTPSSPTSAPELASVVSFVSPFLSPSVSFALSPETRTST